MDIVQRLQEQIVADAFEKRLIVSGTFAERIIHERQDAAAEIELLRSALKGCADDLEAEVEARYTGVKDHPAMTPKYERDMAPVAYARKLLNVGDGQSGEKP